MVEEADANILRVSRGIDHLETHTTCQEYANAEVKLRTRRRLAHRPMLKPLLTLNRFPGRLGVDFKNDLSRTPREFWKYLLRFASPHYQEKLRDN